MKVNLNYVHSTSLGYGRMGVKLAEALSRKGVEVFDHMPSPDMPEPSGTHDGRDSGLAKAACWLSTPTHATGWWSGQSPSMLTMFETMYLPESFREALHEFDTVLVPSRQNVELFGAYHPNVKLVLLGVDPKVWHYIPRQKPGLFFNFLIGGSGPRKGTDLAYEAFLKAFPEGSWGSGPIPRLIRKSPKPELDIPDHERISIVSGKISDQAEVDLYASAHCYLQPSRGEGFGLQPLQAIAQGLPTILTNAHGHESFAHLGWGLSAKPAKAAYFIYGDPGEWWEPDLDELIDNMRWVYGNYGIAEDIAVESAQIVEQQFTWDNTADQFIDALGPDLLEADLTDPGVWKTPQLRKYLVRVKHDCGPYQFASFSRAYKRGVDYFEPADVKRVLFEADLLDPSCLFQTTTAGEGFDAGLTDEQIAKVNGQVGAQQYCDHCGQRLNSQPTKSDDIYAELEAAARRQVAS